MIKYLILSLSLIAFTPVAQAQEPNMALQPEAVGAAPVAAQPTNPSDLIPTANESEFGLSFRLTDRKLRAFAQAAVTIEDVNARWDAMIAGAPTAAEAEELGKAAYEETIQTMDMMDSLMIDEYNELFKAATNNPKLNYITQAYINVFRHDRMGNIPIYGEAQ